jgi:hypothetical protein
VTACTLEISTNIISVTSQYGPLAGDTFRDEAGRNWMLSSYFKLALETRVLFEALMLHMACLISPAEMRLKPEHTDTLLLCRRGLVVRGLRSRLLASHSRVDDTTILAVTCLMVADVRGNQYGYLRRLTSCSTSAETMTGSQSIAQVFSEWSI